MIKIKPISDLHFEFHSDGGEEFIEKLDATDVDVLVLAGDIANVEYLNYNIFKKFCDKFKNVVYCCGNHEFWHGPDPLDLIKYLEGLDSRIENFHFLNNRKVEICGRNFLGATMWFPCNALSSYLERYWCDFKLIKNSTNFIYEQNNLTQLFLENNLNEGDIVVTHHLPSFLSVNEIFKKEDSNCFFVSPMDNLIQTKKPSLWIHGHTHCSTDYMLGETRVICNPYGYSDYKLNDEFKSDLVIEI